MEKKEFQAESKRMLDLMINSIYTHNEIFLREIISNASDAMDKLAYRALTDDAVGLNQSDFKITLITDPIARTLTIRDNGIGMTKEELENNLGTIARSGSLKFKQDMAAQQDVDMGALDIIGQFGVGFYSAFMVADRITVMTRAYGSDTAYCWESEGADGYTIVATEKDTVGTDVILHIKPDTEEEKYNEFLEQYRISQLVKKYSDYIHYPITMLMNRSRQKPRPADAGDDYRTEWEDYTQWETLNSMKPIWQRDKDEVTQEEYDAFYQDKFGDYENPLATQRVSAEGTVSYDALLFIPGKTPYDFYTREYEKGLQLYSSGVLIMDKCGDLLPEHFRFVKGVVDTPDVSLNISREMLQHTRQLKVISKNLEKKIKSTLLTMQEEDREKYTRFWDSFGLQIKYGICSDYGTHKDVLQDLLMFHSSNGDAYTTLAEYVGRMPQDQPHIFFATGESIAKIATLPQAERIRDKGYEILYLTEDVDEFSMQVLMTYQEKTIKSINDSDALPESDEEKQAAEEKSQAAQNVLDFVKQTLGDKISEARISKILKTHPVCMTADGPLSLEMEKYMKRNGADLQGMTAQRVLELNADAPVFAVLTDAVTNDPEKAARYVQLLYHQALLIADLPIEDPSAYTDLVCSLMV